MLDDATKQKLKTLADELKQAMHGHDDSNAEQFRSEIRAILGGEHDRLDEVWRAVFAQANGSTTAIDDL